MKNNRKGMKDFAEKWELHSVLLITIQYLPSIELLFYRPLL